MSATKYFEIRRHGKYWRLHHKPSGDFIQQHLSDFLMRQHAVDCRNRMIAAAPEWDWSDADLCQEMPTATFDRVWAAIYKRGAA